MGVSDVHEFMQWSQYIFSKNINCNLRESCVSVPAIFCLNIYFQRTLTVTLSNADTWHFSCQSQYIFSKNINCNLISRAYALGIFGVSIYIFKEH